MSDPLANLLKRLEAVTERLESIPSSAAGGASAAPSAAAAAADSGDVAPSVEAFDDFLSGSVEPWATKSKNIGGDLAEVIELVRKAFQAERAIILTASKSKQPEQNGLKPILDPLVALIQQITEFREKKRSSPQFNQLSVISEGIPALSWVAVTPKPAPFVSEMKDAAVFYSNRVLKDFKDKDQTQVDFARGFIQTLTELQEYVKKYHTTGLVWNPKGGEAKAAPAAAAPAPAAAAAPAPAAAAAPAKPNLGGVFNALNKGEGITSGLKHVDKSQMTHKNPELRASSVVKADEKKETAAAPKAAPAAKKPPKIELDNNNWFVENHDNNKGIVVEGEIKHVINAFTCVNSTIQVKGKVNAVKIVGCKKTAVVVESVLSTIEVVNCQSVQIQILGKCPTLSIDKTDGLQAYLSKDSSDIEILSAKSSEMNIMLPPKVEGDDYIEKPIPEQFKTTIVNGDLHTTHIVHSG